MVAWIKKKKKPSGRVIRTVILIVLILAALLMFIENNISQMLLDLSYAEANALAVEVLNNVIAEVMKTGVTYEELMNVTKDAQGRVTLLQANTIRMNEIATETAIAAQEMLSNQEARYVKIPLGAALGIGSFAAAGPKIAVQIVPVGAVASTFSTDFESAGINQTRHRILLTVKATIRLVIPTGAKRVEVTTQLPIAESIIIGEVPQTFVDVNNKDNLLNLVP